MPAEITAPYNFVPLNKYVVYPEWGKYISHDYPFNDGLSGSFQLTFKAETPIFVRGGGQKGDVGVVLEFAKIDDRYYIPGSSVKGMLRSVMEIMSFGKLSRFNDNRYSVRDLNNRDVYTLLEHTNNIRSGWLRLTQDEDYPCEVFGVGEVKKVHHENIKVGNESFEAIFGNGSSKYSPQKDDQKTAKYKYKIYDAANSDSAYKLDSNVKEYKVFSGQPAYNDVMKRGKRTGKHHEFLFPKLDPENETVFRLDKQQYIDLRFIYGDHEDGKISKDWEMWKDRLNDGKPIPVFFRVDEEDNLIDLGLSMLYKMPYKNRTSELIERFQNSKGASFKPDMAESIFGYVNDRSQTSLKGRVHVESAFDITKSAVPFQRPISMVLSSPKASYYPTYIDQSADVNGKIKGDKYKTMMDKEAVISGWKRYPIQSPNRLHQSKTGNQYKKIETTLIPLNSGATFTTTIRYQNLKPIELGALLSAITFHDNHHECRHSIGMGKPYGFGSLVLDTINGVNDHEIRYYMGLYEQYMEYKLQETNNGWLRSEQLSELLTMARPTPADMMPQLRYIDSPREHAVLKGKKQALPRHSLLVGSTSLKSLVNDDFEEKKQEAEDLLLKVRDLIASKERAHLTKEVKQIDEKRKEERVEKIRRNKLNGIDELLKITSMETMSRSIGTPNKFGSWSLDHLYKDELEHIQNGNAIFIAEQYHMAFLQHLRNKVYADANKKEVKKWHDPLDKNYYLEKLSFWVGKAKAEKWFDDNVNN